MSASVKPTRKAGHAFLPLVTWRDGVPFMISAVNQPVKPPDSLPQGALGIHHICRLHVQGPRNWRRRLATMGAIRSKVGLHRRGGQDREAKFCLTITGSTIAIEPPPPL